MKQLTDLPKWQPKAVVFDCDGLLMDTEPCWTVAETEAFARRGLPFGDEQKAEVIGKSMAAASERMAELFGETGTGPAIQAELLARVRDVVARQAQAMPGAKNLVQHVRAKMPVAVASNSPRALLDTALKRGEFDQIFPVSVAADEVTNPKPAPDMYLRACDELGVSPAEALAFEDSMTGVRSAQAAGIPVIGVPSLKGEFPADWVISSLEDPQLHTWVANWV